jgi:predicted component of type VI protein secretion system
MDVKRFLSETANRIREEGYDGVRFGSDQIYKKCLQFVNRVSDPGTSIFDDEWDLLVVLDGCRYDLLSEVVDTYDFLGDLDSRRSLNSVTRLWMEANFSPKYEEEMGDTFYISGNPFTKDKIDEASFYGVTEVWKRAWVEPGTVPPRAITDATIRAGRESNPERIIAHYMQPHCPFIPAPDICQTKDVERFGAQSAGDVWDNLQRGEVNKQKVWEGYRQNLEVVLDDMEVLLNNVDADRVAITSDHGNALGEWNIYGHVPNSPIESLRKVPWVETSAVDHGEYEPEKPDDVVEIDRRTQLESLGYL